MWGVIIATIVIALIALWIQQFAVLMRQPDSAFPGRFDKILWVAAFVVVFWLAPIAFKLWTNTSHAYRPIRPE